MLRALPTRPGKHRGEVAEWSNAPDSKSGSRFHRDEGSNPSFSAINIGISAGLGSKRWSEVFRNMDSIPQLWAERRRRT